MNLWICFNCQIWWFCWLCKLYGSCLWMWISWHEGNFLMPLFFVTIGYEMLDWKHSIKTTAPISGAHNFVVFNTFLPIFNTTCVLKRGLHQCFGHHKQWVPYAKTTNKPYFKCLNIDLPTLNTYDAKSQKKETKVKKNMQLLHFITKLENKKHGFIERKKNTHLLWVFVIGFWCFYTH